MAAKTAPVAIGTRGTVGSLVRKEIEYFTKLEFDKCASCRSQAQIVDMSSSSSTSSYSSEDHNSRPYCISSWSLKIFWKRKKSRGNNTIGNFLPRKKQFNGVPGFSCRILDYDVD